MGGCLAGNQLRKTHVSPGHTGSLPSSTGPGVCSPDLQTLSSSSASPLPAWCSQSCFSSAQKNQRLDYNCINRGSLVYQRFLSSSLKSRTLNFADIKDKIYERKKKKKKQKMSNV